MDALGTDAMVIGNHEFDRGALNVATQFQRWSNFPLLGANYKFYDTSDPASTRMSTLLKPFEVFTQQGLKIAVIGMGNLSTLGSLFSQPNGLGMIPLDTNEVAQFYVDLLRPYVDFIVVLSHLGLDADQEMVVSTTGIDIVLGGHNHIVVDPPQLLQDCSADPNNPGYVWAVDPNIPYDPNSAPPAVDNTDPSHPIPLPDPTNHPYEFQRPCAPRNVIIEHSGAFSKYVGRDDLILSNDPARLVPGLRGPIGHVQPERLRPEQRLRDRFEPVPGLPDRHDHPGRPAAGRHAPALQADARPRRRPRPARGILSAGRQAHRAGGRRLAARQPDRDGDVAAPRRSDRLLADQHDRYPHRSESGAHHDRADVQHLPVQQRDHEDAALRPRGAGAVRLRGPAQPGSRVRVASSDRRRARSPQLRGLHASRRRAGRATTDTDCVGGAPGSCIAGQCHVTACAEQTFIGHRSCKADADCGVGVPAGTCVPNACSAEPASAPRTPTAERPSRPASVTRARPGSDRRARARRPSRSRTAMRSRPATTSQAAARAIRS